MFIKVETKIKNPLFEEPPQGNPLLALKKSVENNFHFDPNVRILEFYMLNKDSLNREIFELPEIALSGEVRHETTKASFTVQEGIIMLLWITAIRSPWNFPKVEKYLRLITRKNGELVEYRSRNLSYILTKARYMSGPLSRTIRDYPETYRTLTREMMDNWMREV